MYALADVVRARVQSSDPACLALLQYHSAATLATTSLHVHSHVATLNSSSALFRHHSNPSTPSTMFSDSADLHIFEISLEQLSKLLMHQHEENATQTFA